MFTLIIRRKRKEEKPNGKTNMQVRTNQSRQMQETETIDDGKTKIRMFQEPAHRTHDEGPRRTQRIREVS